MGILGVYCKDVLQPTIRDTGHPGRGLTFLKNFVELVFAHEKSNWVVLSAVHVASAIECHPTCELNSSLIHDESTHSIQKTIGSGVTVSVKYLIAYLPF